MHQVNRMVHKKNKLIDLIFSLNNHNSFFKRDRHGLAIYRAKCVLEQTYFRHLHKESEIKQDFETIKEWEGPSTKLA
jgi:hypothetical protein